MKKIALLILCFAFVGTAFSQLPFMNYQGVARNAAGQPLANQNIAVKTSIVANYPAANTTYYTEVRPVTTNQFGLFSFQLGNPTGATVTPLGLPNVPAGLEYFYIPWEKLTGTRLSTSISTNGGTSYTDIGVNTLASTPFANYAQRAAPWTTTNSLTIVPDNNTWKLGLGTNNATEKLHVVGKLRLQDGQQEQDRLLSSDADGVATWKAPVWKRVPFGLPSNNASNIFVADSHRVRLGIGTTKPQATLHLDGTLILDLATQGAGKVLASDADGRASWKKLDEIAPTGPWIDLDPNTIQTAFANKTYRSVAKVVIAPVSATSTVWTNPVNYPLYVAGTHGISIGVSNFATPLDQQNKFITFFDTYGVKGRIEGQNAAEILNSREFILFNFFRATLIAEYGAEAAAALLQVDAFEVAVNLAAAAAVTAEWITFTSDWENAAGVAYVSGSADYAEWLEKADPSEKFSASDIVEVIGGKISKTITGKGQLMVISLAPIVLGNMPQPGKEKFSEKVAFMGQVPVKVTGDVAIGDYIISSGNNDGMGYAVHPADITPEEYKLMVGVAWSKSSGKMISLINTAVGLQTAAVVDMVKKQEEKLAAQTSQINQLGNYLAAKDASFKFEPLATMPVVALQQEKAKPVAAISANPSTNRTKVAFENYKATLTSAKVKKLLEEHPEAFTETWKMFQETVLEMKNIDLDKNPELKRIVNDREAFVNNIKKAYGLL